MERGLLSDQKLAEFYDQVVWMYLYQDFSDSSQDRAAQRVAIRFGISSWPQHFLVDPYTLEVIGDTGRSLASFEAAVQRAKVGKPGVLTNKALREANARAADLEKDLTDEAAIAALEDADAVMRFRALRHLNESRPEAIASKATELLIVPNDHVRFLVCEVLSKHGTAEHEKVLISLLRNPAGSKNPNVLRIRVVGALARCGEGDAVEAITPFAASEDWFNGLTRVSIDALTAIALRSATHRDSVRKALTMSYPIPPAPEEQREAKFCRNLALRVHGALEELTGRKVPFPEVYDQATREKLKSIWEN